MSTALGVFGVMIALCTLAALFSPHKGGSALISAAAAHTLTQAPGASINYAGNPFRIGTYVYVQEATLPGEHDWQGTFLGMDNGYALVRDAASGVTASVNRDQVFSAHH